MDNQLKILLQVSVFFLSHLEDQVKIKNSAGQN